MPGVFIIIILTIAITVAIYSRLNASASRIGRKASEQGLPQLPHLTTLNLMLVPSPGSRLMILLFASSFTAIKGCAN